MPRNPIAVFARLLIGCLGLIGLVALSVGGRQLVVDGNGELARLEGITGQGTNAQPYILDGFVFQRGDPSVGLVLRNITQPTILRNMVFLDCEAEALRFESCHSIWVLECVFEENAVAVAATFECEDIVLSLNTFRENAVDVESSSGSVDLDDGHVGNWWDSYEGIDTSGDGVGNKPHTFGSGSDSLMDNYPLIAPYAGGAAPQADEFRLETLLSMGDVQSYATVVESVIEISTTTAESTSQITLHGISRTEVLTAPGTGFHEVLTTLADPEIEVVTDGEAMAPTESSDTIERSLMHRFGGGTVTVSSDGDQPSIGPASYAGAPFPVRPIPVGYTWTSEHTQGPEYIGAQRGGVDAQVSYTLVGIEDVDGTACAVLVTATETVIRAETDDPTLGLVTYRGGGTTTLTSWLPLDGGLALRTRLESEVSIRTYVDGDQSGATTTTMRIHMDPMTP